MPKVSIVTPTLNRRDYLKDTIASVQAQSFPDWEMLIVDDGSHDGTGTMIGELFGNDPRIRYMPRKGKKAGASVCRNQGLGAASGEYVLFLDSDDLLAPWCLNRRLEIMETDPAIDFAVFYTQVFFTKPGDGKALWNYFNDDDDLDRFTAFDLTWGPVSVLWRKRVFETIGLWNEDLPSYQDFEIHIRALVYRLHYVKHAEIDSFYRVGTPSSIGVEAKSTKKRVHLKSKQVFLKAVAWQLRQQKAMSEQIAINLAELTAYCCDELLLNQQCSKALKIWFLGYRLKLYGLELLIKGWMFILVAKKKPKAKIREHLFPSSVLWGQKTFYVFDPQVQGYFRNSLKGLEIQTPKRSVVRRVYSFARNLVKSWHEEMKNF